MAAEDGRHGFNIRRCTSSTGRGYVRVTAADGRAVSFYDDGDVRLIRPGLILNLGDVHPASSYVELVSSALQDATADDSHTSGLLSGDDHVR